MASEAIDALERVVAAMQAGDLPRSLRLSLLAPTILDVTVPHENFFAAEPTLDALRVMFPGGADRHEYGAALRGRTKRQTLDAWSYRATLGEPEAGMGRYVPIVTVYYAAPHVDHEWVADSNWGASVEAIRLVWRCKWCGRRPTMAQAAAAMLPVLRRPEP